MGAVRQFTGKCPGFDVKGAALAIGIVLVTSAVVFGGSTRTDELFMPQGGGAGTANGDYIISESPGLNTYYRYFLEVPAGTSRLVVDLFDADVGAGGSGEAAANRDRARGDEGFDTTATYSLRNPSGAAVTTSFTTGNSSAPSGANNAWLTLYDSSSSSTAPAFGSSATATTGGATSLTVTLPTGVASGDLLIAVVALNARTNVGTPGGWTLLDEGDCAGASSTCRLEVFYQYYSSGSSVQFTWSGTQKAIGGVLRYTGASGTPTAGTAATDTSASPTCPSVTTTVANTRVVRIFAAGDDSLSGTPYPAGHAGRYALALGGAGSDLAEGAADTTQASAGATGTAAFALTDSENWRAQTVVIAPALVAPAAGHWELRVDQSTSGGNDLNAIGLRAHDGTADTGGTEIPVYYDSHSQYGVNPDPASATRSYDVFPYITSGCSCFENDFDYDTNNGSGNGPTGYAYGRVQLWTRSDNASTDAADRHQDVVSSSLAGDNVWQRDTVNSWTTDTDADEYGIWRADVDISTYTTTAGENGNYTNLYFTNASAGSAAPSANPTTNAFRVYLANDGGTAPVKPYIRQHVLHVSGPNPPTSGETERVRVTVSVVNPTASAITFSTSNLVYAYVPGTGTNGSATYVGGSRQRSQGSWVSSELADGGTGAITWNPTTVNAGATAFMTFDVNVTPTATSYDIPVVGTWASGNGTYGQWVDETGNTSQSRATYRFGPLCELRLDEGTVTKAWVSEMWSESDPRGFVVAWETVSEVGTTGFELYRRDRQTGDWSQVHDGLLLAMHDAPRGGVYRYLDRDASPYETQQYALVEVEIDGDREVIGPFELMAGAGMNRGGTEMPDDGFTREPREGGAAGGPQGSPAARAGAGPEQAPAPAAARVLQVGVDSTALYVVPTSLVGSSTPIGGGRPSRNTSSYSVTNGGRPVAWTYTPSRDGILFVGEGIDSVYTSENVYRVAAGAGSTMTTATTGRPLSPAAGGSFPATTHAEVDRFPLLGATVNPQSDYWYWDYLSAGDPRLDRKSFPVDAYDLAAGGSAALTVALAGASSAGVAGEHAALIRLNGVEVGRVSWDGITSRSATFGVAPALVREGANTVEVEAVLGAAVPYSVFYVDSFDLTYNRHFRARGDSLAFTSGGKGTVTVTGFTDPSIVVFDVTSPRNAAVVGASLVTGSAGDYSVSIIPASPTRRYLAVSRAGWRTPLWTESAASTILQAAGDGAEYVVITREGLAEAAQELADYREAQGLTSRVVTVEDVMDEFNFGVDDPHAIASFLAYAWNNWSPRPRYVVLAGGGTLDYRDNLGYDGNVVPPLMLATPSGLLAADNAYADLAGGDGIPEVAIGRLPARDADELSDIIAKIRAYEGTLPAGWAHRALLIADVPSQGTDFAEDSEKLGNMMPAGYEIGRIYLGETSSMSDARDLLFASLNGGAGIVNYIGHGSIDRISSKGLLTNDDVPYLSNGPRNPVFVALTCLVNRFELPQYACLGETLLASPSGGAIAAWGPSGLADNVAVRELGKSFFARLGSGSEVRLGDAVLAALRHGAAGGSRRIADVYNLLGDPALVLKAPEPASPPGGDTGGE